MSSRFTRRGFVAAAAGVGLASNHALPVLVDSDRETFQIDARKIHVRADRLAGLQVEGPGGKRLNPQPSTLNAQPLMLLPQGEPL